MFLCWYNTFSTFTTKKLLHSFKKCTKFGLEKSWISKFCDFRSRKCWVFLFFSNFGPEISEFPPKCAKFDLEIYEFPNFGLKVSEISQFCKVWVPKFLNFYPKKVQISVSKVPNFTNSGNSKQTFVNFGLEISGTSKICNCGPQLSEIKFKKSQISVTKFYTFRKWQIINFIVTRFFQNFQNVM